MIRSRIIPSHTSLGPLGSQPPSFVILSDARRSATTKRESKDLLLRGADTPVGETSFTADCGKGQDKKGHVTVPPSSQDHNNVGNLCDPLRALCFAFPMGTLRDPLCPLFIISKSPIANRTS